MEEIGHLNKGKYMFLTKIKRAKSLISTCGLAVVLALSQVPLPSAHAAESCFEGVDDTADYDGGDMLYAKVRATCDMELYYMDISFTGTDGILGISEHIPMAEHAQMSEITRSDDYLRIWWNDDENEPDTRDGRPYVDVSSGENLFYMAYNIGISTNVFKRNLPITINSARYKIGDEMRTEENVSLDSILTVTHDGKDVIMVTGIEAQEVSYTGQPVVLEGNLAVEENAGNITAEDLSVVYYNSISRVDQPTEPGDYEVNYYYDEGNYLASLKIPFTIKDYVTIDTSIWAGQGTISAPHYVDMGGSAHIEITPADGSEILWVEQDGVDVTDLLDADNSLYLENLTSDTEIEAAFRPFYQVTDGDGGEYIQGSGSNLAFMIDKDSSSYYSGIVVVVIDGESIDMNTDALVEPEAQTVSLLSDYLDTLDLGEHKIEIHIFDTIPNGIARATFTVVEAEEEEETAEDGTITVPDTGTSTSGLAGAEASVIAASLTGSLVAVIFLAVKLSKKEA